MISKYYTASWFGNNIFYWKHFNSIMVCISRYKRAHFQSKVVSPLFTLALHLHYSPFSSAAIYTIPSYPHRSPLPFLFFTFWWRYIHYSILHVHVRVPKTTKIFDIQITSTNEISLTFPLYFSISSARSTTVSSFSNHLPSLVCFSGRLRLFYLYTATYSAFLISSPLLVQGISTTLGLKFNFSQFYFTYMSIGRYFFVLQFHFSDIFPS